MKRRPKRAKAGTSKAKTKSRKPASRATGWRSAMVRLITLIGLIGGMAAGLYLLYLNHVVTLKFEGKRWAVPARVYGRALELYPGATLEADQLATELERLGYRKVGTPKDAGSYARNGTHFLLRTRPFRFWDGEEPARLLDLRFNARQLASMTDGAGKPLTLARLEAPVVGSLYPSHNEDRVLLKREELPKRLVEALLAVEDRTFFEHQGISLRAIGRALLANVRAGGVVQGGSTLTQQLVKNFFLTAERKVGRKVTEALMALLLEQRYAKDEILEAYANEIYLGQDGSRAIHGFGLASHFYFNRPLAELDTAQLALLAGLVRGPSYYNPRRHTARARERRDLVLELMREQGFLSAAEAERARKAGLGVSDSQGRGQGSYPAFLDLVRRQLHRDYREEDLTSEGLRIFTTLDPWLQSQAEQALAGQLKALEQERRIKPGVLQGAVVVAGPGNGEVLALVGDRHSRFAGFNRALDAVRPIGSLVKPAVYLTALREPERYTLVTPLDDAPVSLTGPKGKIWSPDNYDRISHGRVRLYEALAHSYNQATVRLGMDVGLERVAETLHDLGVNRPLDVYPSLLLGAISLSPVEVAQVYQTLAAGGFYSPLRAIREVLTDQGQPLQRYPLTVRQAVPAAPVYLVNSALQAAVRQGTGRSLSRYVQAGLNLAGKTGTTDELRDSWFAGFSSDKVAVVWVGRDDNEPAGLTGASGALRVWGDFMRRAPPLPFDMPLPPAVELVWLDTQTSLRADERCPGAQQLPFLAGSAPQQYAPCASPDVSGPSLFDSLRNFFQ